MSNLQATCAIESTDRPTKTDDRGGGFSSKAAQHVYEGCLVRRSDQQGRGEPQETSYTHCSGGHGSWRFYEKGACGRLQASRPHPLQASAQPPRRTKETSAAAHAISDTIAATALQCCVCEISTVSGILCDLSELPRIAEETKQCGKRTCTREEEEDR